MSSEKLITDLVMLNCLSTAKLMALSRGNCKLLFQTTYSIYCLLSSSQQRLVWNLTGSVFYKSHLRSITVVGCVLDEP